MDLSLGMVKVGDLVRPNKISLTADEHGENMLGLVVGYNKWLAHPYEIRWFGKHQANLKIWEAPEDIKVISNAKFWRKNESWR